MKILISVLVLVDFSLVLAKLNPLSDDFIELINKKQTTWKAGRNFHPDTPITSIQELLGVHPDNKKYRLPERPYIKDEGDIPENFDAREAWPDCANIIGEIRDQAACGSCWAFGAVEAMSDRICIHSNATRQIFISAQDLLTCCSACGFGCQGGYLAPAWEFWTNRGLVTGGGYQSKIGCKTYSIEPCDHYVDGQYDSCGNNVPTPDCVETCDEGYETSFEDDLTFGEPYSIPINEQQMQLEILENGPVEAVFEIYEDFYTYKSGVYQHVEGGYQGNHAIKILGWGVEDDIPYWLIANSFNTDWGDAGYFKILRGVNHCEIESDVIAGIPVLSKRRRN